MFLISLFLPYLEVKFTKITKAVMKIKSTTKRVAITNAGVRSTEERNMNIKFLKVFSLE